MGELVTYEQFREAWRKKKYGDVHKRLKAMNFNEDFNPFEDEVDEYFYGQKETDEDYWLGEKKLTDVIKEQ